MHPVYYRQAAHWTFLQASAIGQPVWGRLGSTGTLLVPTENLVVGADGTDQHTIEKRNERCYLRRHRREEDEDYESRLRISPYYNFVAPFVATWVGSIVRAITSVQVPPVMDSFLENCDKRGKTWKRHAEEWLYWSMVFGHSHSYPSLPKRDQKYESREQEEAAGISPMVRGVTPLQLPGWSYHAEAADYDWAHLRLPKTHRTTAPSRPESGRIPTTTLQIYEDRVEDILLLPKRIVYADKERPDGNGYGFVPLVTLIAEDDPTEAEPVGLSPVRDVAETARIAFNQLSWLLDQEMNTCFAQLVLKTQRKINRNLALRLGTSSYLAAENGADWISPSVDPMEHLSESVGRTVDYARTMMTLDHQGKEGVEAASALAMKRELFDSRLSTLAERAQAAFTAELRMVGRMLKQKPAVIEEIKVQIGRDFSGITRLAKMEQALAVLKDGALKGLAAAQCQKLIVDALFPELPEDERTALHDEIEAEATAPAEIGTGMETPEGGDPPPDGAPPAPPAPGGPLPKVAPPGMKPGVPRAMQKRPGFGGKGAKRPRPGT